MVYIFGLAALILINLQSFVFPVFVSYGGQWARVKRGGGDQAFYPQTSLYPVDMFLYIAVLVFVAWLARKYILQRNFNSLLRLYLIAGIMPIVWAVLALLSGFNYQKCNIPSTAYTCQNPSGRIIQRVLLNIMIVALTLVCIKVISLRRANKKS